MSLHDRVLEETAKFTAAPSPGGEGDWRKKFGDKPWEHHDPKHILKAYKALYPPGTFKRPTRLVVGPEQGRPKPKTPPPGNKNWGDVARKRRRELDPDGDRWS